MKKLVKRLAVAAVSLAMLAAAEAADTVPAKFQGTWVSAETKDDIPMTIGAKTIRHGSGSACNITSVTPGDEVGKAIIITWKCPETPNMRPVELVLKLTKVAGQEMLLQTNTECNACWLSISRRVKP